MTSAQKRLRDLRDRQSRERGRMAEFSLVDELSNEQRSALDTIEKGCASHLSHPGCIKNADRSAGTGDGTIFAVRRA